MKREIQSIHTYPLPTLWVRQLFRYVCVVALLFSLQLPIHALTDGSGYATFPSATTSALHYYTRDHQGNVRAVVSEGGAVEQVTHYYPFGGVFADAGTGSAVQRYKYNGKELDRMHGLDWYDYGARMYDALVPMFAKPDRMAEKYYYLSPYAYCGSNPVNAIDVNGDSIFVDLGHQNEILGYSI